MHSIISQNRVFNVLGFSLCFSVTAANANLYSDFYPFSEAFNPVHPNRMEISPRGRHIRMTRVLRPSDPRPRFYAYKDPETNSFYFHNPISNESAWGPPPDCLILHADTLQPFGPLSEAAPAALPLRAPSGDASSIRTCSSLLRIAPQVHHRASRIRAHESGTLLLLRQEVTVRCARSELPSLPFYFPPSMQSDQNLIDLAAFAKAHFRPSKKSSKKSAPADDPSVASESAALIPLLKSVDHKNSKAAVKLFSYVVAYGKNANERPLASFVENLSLELVDEAFMQVIRQTRQNPSPEATVRMWHLLLCLSTLFFASPVIQPVVRQTLATAAFGGNVVIAQFAQLAYFRFDARCQIGAHVKAPPAQFVESIPSHVNECHMTLGASLCELMWHQRTTFPKCRVPVFMHRICKALIGQGAFEKEGVFKNVGNQVVVEKLCADIDNGTAALADADLTVLATVFKRWLALLPWPMVPIDVYPKLLEQDQGKNYVAIADDLPRISRDSLAYLVGFLKDFVKAEPRTGMGLVPVAMMFGLTVVRPSHFHQTKMRELYEVSKDFMVALVQSWDVSDVYPLNEALYL